MPRPPPQAACARDAAPTTWPSRSRTSIPTTAARACSPSSSSRSSTTSSATTASGPKIECMIRDYVSRGSRGDRPNVVALTEDVGMMTLATGSRGRLDAGDLRATRQVPGCEARPRPAGSSSRSARSTPSTPQQEAAYDDPLRRAPRLLEQTFVAGTDTFARGWMQTFSDLARRYDVYILGSNNQPRVPRVGRPERDRAVRRPRRPRPDERLRRDRARGLQRGIHVGAAERHPEGPRPLRNVVARNQEGAADQHREGDQPDPGAEERAGRDRERRGPTGSPGRRRRCRSRPACRRSSTTAAR